MKIITCLGNPGIKYAKNRHNAGFIFGSYFAEKFNILTSQKAFSSITGRGKIEGVDVLILFPQTFMNNSGLAIQSAMHYYGESSLNLIVIHDEIELPFGVIRTKSSGGHKGHNGVRSIIQHINTPEFYRIRIGIGRPTNPNITVSDYLLSDFSMEELRKMEDYYPIIIDELMYTLNDSKEV